MEVFYDSFQNNKQIKLILFHLMKKSFFEFNQANNYLWNHQGKRHYWGMKGKDYGLVQSLNNNREGIEQHKPLEFLKNKLINLSQNQYQQRMSQRTYEQKPSIGIKNNERMFLDDPNQYKYHYVSEKPANLYHIKTQPVQHHEENYRRYEINSNQLKKRHLSLMSKNIQISNRQTPNIEHAKRFSTLDYADQKERQLQQAQKKVYKRVNTQANIEDNEMKKYREKIIKVVKRDRKNNPTFCNSLAYPLHCYRYVQ